MANNNGYDVKFMNKILFHKTQSSNNIVYPINKKQNKEFHSLTRIRGELSVKLLSCLLLVTM